MLQDQEIGSKLIEIALHDKEFDIMLIYERNYMEWYTAVRVLQGALKNEDDIANESGEALQDTTIIELQNNVILIEFNPNNTNQVLLNAYNQRIRPFFKREQMNLFFLHSVKMTLNTIDPQKSLFKTSIGFNYASVPRIQLDPEIIVRRLYKSGKFDGPIKEVSNKR